MNVRYLIMNAKIHFQQQQNNIIITTIESSATVSSNHSLHKQVHTLFQSHRHGMNHLMALRRRMTRILPRRVKRIMILPGLYNFFP
jgi:hypothetical protein